MQVDVVCHLEQINEDNNNAGSTYLKTIGFRPVLQVLLM